MEIYIKRWNVMQLLALTKDDCEKVRIWRNSCIYALRTPFLLTEEMQKDFYNNVISSRNAKARFWGVWDTHPKPTKNPALDIDKVCAIGDYFLGMVGLENIEYENRRAEISIMLNPDYRGQGYGSKAVVLLLEQGFMYMNLENIWGEVYTCNPNGMVFWERIVKKYNGSYALLEKTKYYNGKYWNSLWFNITKEGYKKCLK